MRLKMLALALPLALTVNACSIKAGENDKQANVALPKPRTVDLIDNLGTKLGTVVVSDSERGLSLSVAIEGLPPGAHGIHLHETGICDTPTFKQAGGHWNPTGRQHGRDNPEGAHVGDLSNLVIDENGRGEDRFIVPGVTLAPGPNSVADQDGTSLIIHAGKDDYKTDPSGNSGDRAVCAVIAPPK